jgi:hypothetical protein
MRRGPRTSIDLMVTALHPQTLAEVALHVLTLYICGLAGRDGQVDKALGTSWEFWKDLTARKALLPIRRKEMQRRAYIYELLETRSLGIVPRIPYASLDPGVTGLAQDWHSTGL